MNRRIRVEPEAEAELQGAAEWYEAQQDGLGGLYGRTRGTKKPRGHEERRTEILRLVD